MSEVREVVSLSIDEAVEDLIKSYIVDLSKYGSLCHECCVLLDRARRRYEELRWDMMESGVVVSNMSRARMDHAHRVIERLSLATGFHTIPSDVDLYKLDKLVLSGEVTKTDSHWEVVLSSPWDFNRLLGEMFDFDDCFVFYQVLVSCWIRPESSGVVVIMDLEDGGLYWKRVINEKSFQYISVFSSPTIGTTPTEWIKYINRDAGIASEFFKEFEKSQFELSS